MAQDGRAARGSPGGELGGWARGRRGVAGLAGLIALGALAVGVAASPASTLAKGATALAVSPAAADTTAAPALGPPSGAEQRSTAALEGLAADPSTTASPTTSIDPTTAATSTSRAPTTQAAPTTIAHGQPLKLAKPSGPGKVEVRTIADPKGVKRMVAVYTPPVADPNTLPVVYFLHGYPGSPNDALDSGFAQTLDQAFAAGATPFVLVVPDGNSAVHPDTEWADAVDGSVRLETFVTETLIQAVEKDHPRTRNQRAIAGFSMGGFGAVNLAQRHPDLYGQAVSLGGYFHVDDITAVFAANAAIVNANSPDHHLDRLRTTRVALFQGTGDGDRPEAGELERMKGLLDAAHVPNVAARTPGGHTWFWANQQLPAVINFLAQGWLT